MQGSAPQETDPFRSELNLGLGLRVQDLCCPALNAVTVTATVRKVQAVQPYPETPISLNSGMFAKSY